MNYWFRPKRFWNWFALYVPTSLKGWLATGILFLLGVLFFILVDNNAHSGSDTLIGFAPWAITLLVIFDSLCFRFGEYPAWWKKIH
jgi:hypothetical protein